MKSAATVLALLVLLGGWANTAPVVLEDAVVMNNPSNPTGVDVRVVSASVDYTNAADEQKYKMFSSNHPILGFNRPAELFVIDAMVNVSATLTITVENIGTAASGTIDINTLLLHDDYTYFEFVNSTVQMASLAGGSSNTVIMDVVPTYAGNHTLSIRATSTIADDNPSNDVRNQPFTVGHSYFNCDSSAAWTFGSGWMLSTDTSISQGRSCHAGNGEASNYNNNVIASLTTPVMDMSDALPNPSRTNGVSFFYTGATAANDKLTIFGKNRFGAWSEVGSISGVIDNVFIDGANWQTFSVNNKGHASPLIPVADDLFHAASQFKFEFTSDASGTDIGFFIDDIVFVYEQKVRPDEFNVSAQGISTNGAVPGEWGSISLNVINTGNISEIFIPRLEGLPQGWAAYYTRPTGTSFNPEDGLFAQPGSPAPFNIMIQPDVNASLGFQQMTVNISSQQYPGVYTLLPVQFLVKADRIPVIVPPTVRPSCPPGYTCTFDVELTNQGGATDVFDLMIDASTVPDDWSVDLSWSQTNSVLIRPGESVQAMFMMTTPTDAAPDTVVEFDLSLTAQNDTTRVDVKTIPISASMVSVASVALNLPVSGDEHIVAAGEHITLKYTIWNNATRQDIFAMRVDVEDQPGWIVHQPTRPDAVLNPGATTTFEVVVEIPADARADEQGPTITPVIESKRSLMEIQGEPYSGLTVESVNDLSLTLVDAPTKLRPGQPNELQWTITNHGNGAANARLMISDVPADWSWWVAFEGSNTTDPVPLGASFDENHAQQVSLYLSIPLSVPAGSIHTITVHVIANGNEHDTTPENNTVEVVMSTEAIRVPSLELVDHSTTAMAGGTISAQAVVRNDGNAPESTLLSVGRVSSTPPLPGMVVFYSVEGADQPLATPTPLLIPAGGEQRLQLEVLIPADAQLNTRFVFEFEILGVVDDEGLPVEMKVQALVMINEQRAMTTEAGLMQQGTVPHGTSAPVQINLTSTSTLNENTVVYLEGESGWQLTCNKMLVNESGVALDFTPGHINPQSANLRCEVLRMNGPQEGTIAVTVATEDGFLTSSHTLSLMFAPEPEESTMGGVAVLVGGGGFLAILGLTVLVLRRRATGEDEAPLTHQPAGPPASNVGQPKTVPSIDETVQPTAQQPEVAPSAAVQRGPPIPEAGLPAGWTEEQWQYYGQQYLDGTL